MVVDDIAVDSIDRQCPHCEVTVTVERRDSHRGLHLTHAAYVVYFEDLNTFSAKTGFTNAMADWMGVLHGG